MGYDRPTVRLLPLVAASLALSFGAAALPSPVRGAGRTAPPPRHVPAAVAALAALPRADLQARITADSARAQTVWLAGHADSAMKIFAPLVAAAPHLPDTTLRNRILLLDVTFKYRLARIDEARAELDGVLRMAEAARDTHAIVRGLVLDSGLREARGQNAGLEPPMRRAMALAEAVNARNYLGHVHYRLGVLAIYRGDHETARRELRAALDVYEAVPLPESVRNATNQLGNVEYMSGRYPEARVLYQKTLDLAEKAHDLASQAHAWNNLGAIESRIGDLQQTLVCIERARDLFSRTGDTVSELYSVGNLAEMLLLLGQIDRARAVTERGLAVAEQHGMQADAAQLRVQLGVAMAHSGRRGQAKETWRSIIALSDDRARKAQVDAMRALADELGDEDSLDAALAVVRTALVQPGRHVASEIAGFRLSLARLLLETRRPAEALAIARSVADTVDREEDNLHSLDAWTIVTAAERRLGRFGAASAAFDTATRRWERARGESSSWDFRETTNDDARRLMMEGIALALAEPGPRPVRIARAFDRMERFKTRTLLERMRGPRAAELAPAALPSTWGGLDRFRRERLFPGELLLEFAGDADTTWLFAVARDTCAIFGLPGGNRLAPAARLATDVFAHPQPAGARDAVRAVARAQGALLLGPARGLIARAKTLVVAPDLGLHRVPFAALALEGDRPLAASHEVVIVPSATLLDALRAFPPEGQARGLLAMLGGGRTGSPRLAGAEREVKYLADRYQGVEQWDARSGHALPALDGYLALHIAGHSRVDDQYPWRSAVEIGGSDSVLTAAAIADRRLRAQLVVLSSCESAGGTERLGEGVAGLATAFLAARVPAVVATLWPVDDDATAAFMARFYDELAAGRTAAEAMRRTQMALRGGAEAGHPDWWAGFVLVGDGHTTIPLSRRPAWGRLLQFAAPR